jgi:hypothetical protein
MISPKNPSADYTSADFMSKVTQILCLSCWENLFKARTKLQAFIFLLPVQKVLT